MKKLLLVCALALSIASFADNGKIVKKVSVNNRKAVACCTVATVTVCGYADEPLCDRARAKYLQKESRS